MFHFPEPGISSASKGKLPIDYPRLRSSICAPGTSDGADVTDQEGKGGNVVHSWSVCLNLPAQQILPPATHCHPQSRRRGDQNVQLAGLDFLNGPDVQLG
jgi:hypothetical protein